MSDIDPDFSKLSLTEMMKLLRDSVESYSNNISNLKENIDEAAQARRTVLSNVIDAQKNVQQQLRNVSEAQEDLKESRRRQVNAAMDLKFALSRPANLIYSPEMNQCNDSPFNNNDVVNAAMNLSQNDVHVWDDFLLAHIVSQLRQKVMKMHEDGALQDGLTGGGRSGSGEKTDGYRSDVISYLAPEDVDKTDPVAMFAQTTDSLIQQLCFEIEELSGKMINRQSVMISCYPGNNSRYTAHVDNPNENGRLLTAILYLNDGWSAGDGGQLRLHRCEFENVRHECEDYIDIEPVENRLVLFWSDKRNLHEVLPVVAKNRYAVSIWYQDARERACVEVEQELDV